MRVQMLGLCRFSYLGGRGFQVLHETIEERRAFLYDPERLARRWFWFEAVTLPALVKQTDPDFTLVLMTGPDLPEPYLSRLRELAELMPQFKLSLVPPIEYHLEACMAAIRPHIEPQADVVGHFRQDDDDAVAVDYIECARRDFARMQPLWEIQRKLFCDYSRGLVVKATETGVSVELRMIYTAVAALTVYLPPDAGRSIMHFPHWRIAQYMPGVTLPDRLMYVRFLNHDNDSGAIGPGYTLPETVTDWTKALARRFRIDLPSLDQAARDFSLPGAMRPHWGR
jgi:hypothetical protein